MRRALSPTFAAALLAVASAAHAAGPVTKGPWIQKVTPTSAVVRVEVDPPGPATLELGMSAAGTGDGGSGRVLTSAGTTALHSFLVDNLDPATRYAFTVRAHGAPKYGAVTTAPRDDSGAPFRFLVYGDNRSDDAAHAAVVRSMASVASDFLVNTGDLVEHGGSPSQWQTFFDIEAPLTRERCIFSCVGNHELVDGSGIEYVKYFGPAELPPGAVGSADAGAALAAPTVLSPDQLNGTFRWSNARFFLVNGMVSYKSGASRAWLEKVLAEADDEKGLVWRIVVTHHGPWSSGPHGDNLQLHDANVPQILKAHKVDLVLAGHDHIYERGFADGMPYIVSGGGGAPTYRIKQKGPFSRRSESVRHFVEASASAVAIQFAATRPDGTVIERCGLRKNEGWDCDGTKSPTVTASPSAAGGTSDGQPPGTGSAGPSKCGCRTVGEGGDGPPGILGAPAAALGVAIAALARRRRGRAILDA